MRKHLLRGCVGLFVVLFLWQLSSQGHRSNGIPALINATGAQREQSTTANSNVDEIQANVDIGHENENYTVIEERSNMTSIHANDVSKETLKQNPTTNVPLSITHARVRKSNVNRFRESPQNLSENILCSNELRLNAIKRVCTERNISNLRPHSYSVQYKQVFVDEIHQVVYCAMPKVATNTWIKHMALASGKISSYKEAPERFSSTMATLGIRPLHSFNQTEVDGILNTFTKFMVVRHPFGRLVSAWRDKLVRWDPRMTQKLAMIILLKYRGRYNETDKVRFDEFAKYVASGAENDHWRSFQACMPCSIKYDYILRTETSDLDANPVLQKLGISDGLPKLHVSGAVQNTMTLVLNDFKDVEPSVTDSLLRMYDLDMKMFGYRFSRQSLDAKCSLSRQENSSCC